MIFFTGNPLGIEKAKETFDKLVEKGARIEIKEIKRTRSWLQNRALHLLFEQVAQELNGLGIPFVYHGMSGTEYETEWTGELFKQFTWKPIQLAMYGTNSTTKLTSVQIDKIFQSINKFFADRGVEVSFPNKFDYYLKFYDNDK